MKTVKGTPSVVDVAWEPHRDDVRSGATVEAVDDVPCRSHGPHMCCGTRVNTH